MTNKEKIISAQLAVNLLITVSTYHSPEIAASVVEHYGDPHSMGSFAMEEMMDDLISKMNDLG